MARSNRTLTQFVVDRILFSLKHGPEAVGRSEAGNTRVEADIKDTTQLVVYLFENEIIRLVYSPQRRNQVIGAIISTGDFYDSSGRPSRTTRERLNGILDALGTASVIPAGVRVFVKSDDGQCYLGKGDKVRVFNHKCPRLVILSDFIMSLNELCTAAK